MPVSCFAQACVGHLQASDNKIMTHFSRFVCLLRRRVFSGFSFYVVGCRTFLRDLLVMMRKTFWRNCVLLQIILNIYDGNKLFSLKVCPVKLLPNWSIQMCDEENADDCITASCCINLQQSENSQQAPSWTFLTLVSPAESSALPPPTPHTPTSGTRYRSLRARSTRLVNSFVHQAVWPL